MSLFEIFMILLIHWVADFVLQTDWQAKNKSINNNALLTHTGAYSIVWLVIFGPLFGLITFVTHTVTDYFTSRLNKYLWEKGDVHNFFVSVGFDQVLHYVQLFLTYQLLK